MLLEPQGIVFVCSTVIGHWAKMAARLTWSKYTSFVNTAARIDAVSLKTYMLPSSDVGFTLKINHLSSTMWDCLKLSKTNSCVTAAIPQLKVQNQLFFPTPVLFPHQCNCCSNVSTPKLQLSSSYTFYQFFMTEMLQFGLCSFEGL